MGSEMCIRDSKGSVGGGGGASDGELDGKEKAMGRRGGRSGSGWKKKLRRRRTDRWRRRGNGCRRRTPGPRRSDARGTPSSSAGIFDG